MNKNKSMITPFNKFFWWSFFTFGFYPVIWSYRVWKHINTYVETENKKLPNDIKLAKVDPFARAFFFLFFVPILFKRGYEMAQKMGYKEIIAYNMWAGLVIILAFIDRFISKYEFDINSAAEYSLYVISYFLFFILSLVVFKKPLEMFNFYFSKIEQEREYKKRTLHWWEIILMIIGAVLIAPMVKELLMIPFILTGIV